MFLAELLKSLANVMTQNKQNLDVQQEDPTRSRPGSLQEVSLPPAKRQRLTCIDRPAPLKTLLKEPDLATPVADVMQVCS